MPDRGKSGTDCASIHSHSIIPTIFENIIMRDLSGLFDDGIIDATLPIPGKMTNRFVDRDATSDSLNLGSPIEIHSMDLSHLFDDTRIYNVNLCNIF